METTINPRLWIQFMIYRKKVQKKMSSPIAATHAAAEVQVFLMLINS
jgi:hypothetical protein